MKRVYLYIALLIFISDALISCRKEREIPPPVANFTCDKTNGAYPLIVNFTSTSKGEIDTYTWDFGDGNTSTSRNPENTYHNPGTFKVMLIVEGPGGSDSLDQTITVIEAAPKAGFICDTTSGVAPLTIEFTSTSTGNITSYAWDFGDGMTSSEQHPSHTFSNGGNYTVVHTVTGPGGSNSSNKLITVNDAPPQAVFTCDKTSGVAPLTVKYTSASTGNITSYSWVFGDGGTSTDQNPTHTFTTSGVYNSSLTVTGPGGEDMDSKTITVNDVAPVAIFTCDPISGNAPLTVNFTSTSTGNISTYAWAFGDGGTSSSQNPSYTYNEPGNYTATLTVTGPGGSNSANKTITVNAAVITTDVSFYNPVYTDIYITFAGITKTIAPGNSVTYDDIQGSSANLYAYTNGTTNLGNQVGLKITWYTSIPLYGGTASYNLNITSDYFFLFMTNQGTHVLINLYVNYGTTYQTYDDIIIGHNSVKYSIGYYRAMSNSNVRMYYQDNQTSYTNWNQGVHFFLPWTDNQSISLTNTFKSDPGVKNETSKISNLIPAQNDRIQKNPRAKDLYCR